MKKYFVFAVVFITITNAFGQNSSEYYRVTKYMKDRGWALTPDNRWANLKESGYTSWWSRYFSSALEYAVVAFSDDPDVLDVDVEVTDLYGNEVSSDNDEDEWAIATFYLSYSRDLRIRMTNYSSLTPYYASRCRYLIFYR